MSLPIKCLEFVAILVVSADTGLLEGILPYVRAEWGKMANLRGNHETESAEMRPYAGPRAPMLGAYLGCFAKDIACNELAGPGRSNSR